jgi:hypothetical protein
VNRFDVSVYAIPRRTGRRRPFEVRWQAAGRSRSKSFLTRKLADSYRAELVRAKARAVLQTAFYSHLLAGVQGVEPRWMHLALGNGEFVPFKVSDYAAYDTMSRRRWIVSPSCTGRGRRRWAR